MPSTRVIHVHLFVAFCLLTIAKADWWDDFSNNLATDLSPLLALFGEQVTKQFLSESTSILDNLIFAMAPLGIVTAVVSAIRVCGGPSLRAFIGRAQEGGGIAEAELCSSTSRDVCELYHNGAIVRVFGRPKILEVMHDHATNDFYHLCDDQGQLKSPRHGIYLSQEYLEEASTNNTDWKEIPEQKDVEAPKQGAGKFAPNPNLSFNISITKQPRYVYFLAVGLGILAQGSFIVFGCLATYFWQWEKNGGPPPVWAFPLMAVGTMTLSCGMFFCAFLIETSTEERVFLKKSKNSKCATGTESTNKACQSTIYIVRPGNQSIGDQTYDSFAFSDAWRPLKEYTTSWKEKDSSRPGEKLQVWFATGLTILGFGFQFIGLRAMHSSVSVVLLAAILFMSIVRSILRTGRLKKEQNLLKDRPDEVEGHELDWLAMQMSRDVIDKDDGPFWSLLSSPLLHNCLEINRPSDDGRGGTISLDGNSSLVFEGVVEEKEDGKSLICAFKDFITEPRWLSKPEYVLSSALGDQPRTAAKMFYYRSRLAELTSQPGTNNKSKGSSDWGDRLVPLRRQAQQLKTAIESGTQILCSHGGMKPGWRKARSLAFSVNIMVSSPSNSSYEVQQVQIFVRQPDTNTANQSATWEVDRNSLEAVLGLWNWSIVSDNKMEEEDETGLRMSVTSEVTKARVIAIGASPDELESAQTEFETWSNDLFAFTKPQKWIMKPGDRPVGASTVWKKTDGNRSLEPRLDRRDPKKQLIRLFGWPGSRLSNGMLALAMVVDLSTAVLCAQEVYQSFIGAMATTLDSIHGSTTTRARDSSRMHLSNDVISRLAESFVSSRLGSYQDAYSILIPVLSRRSKLPRPTEALPELYSVAKESRLAGRFEEAETNLQWARQVNFQARARQQDSNLGEATLELAELYRCAWRASLLEKDSEKREKARDVGHRGSSWLKKMQNSRETQPCPVEIKEKVMSLYAKLSEEWDIQNIVHYNTVSEILQALVKNKRELCLSLVFESLNFADEKRRTVLSWAAESNWLPIVKESLRLGFQVDSEDESKRTPLSYAAENGHVDVVRMLLQHGALPLTIDLGGRTPLSYASQQGHTSVMDILMNYRTLDVGAIDERGWSPLHWAAAHGKQESIKLLVIKERTSIDIVDRCGRTPLIIALINGHEAAGKQLIAAGSTWDIKIGKDKSWTWAFSNGHWLCGEFLLNLVDQESEVREKSVVSILLTPSKFLTPSPHHMALGSVLFPPIEISKQVVTMCEMTDDGAQRLATPDTLLRVLGSPCRREMWIYKFDPRGVFRGKDCLEVCEDCSLKYRVECLVTHLGTGVEATRQICLEVVRTLPRPGLSDQVLVDALQLLVDLGGDEFVVSHDIVLEAAKNTTLAESTLPILLKPKWQDITLRILTDIMRLGGLHYLKLIRKYLETQKERGVDVSYELMVAVLQPEQDDQNILKLLLNYRRGGVNPRMIFEELKRSPRLDSLPGGFRLAARFEGIGFGGIGFGQLGSDVIEVIENLIHRHNAGEVFQIEGLDS